MTMRCDTSRRLELLIVLMMGLMMGIILGLLYCTWYQPVVPIEREGWYIHTPYEGPYIGAGKSKDLKPDTDAPMTPQEEEQLCDCISFVEDTPEEDEIGLLCRCDVKGKPPLWFFEGSAEGLAQLYIYLDEGVKEYYQDLQQKRWPREGLPEEPNFSEEPFERQL